MERPAWGSTLLLSGTAKWIQIIIFGRPIDYSKKSSWKISFSVLASHKPNFEQN
jgi:hypothetical protein